jgi:hypothetical protein
MTRKDFIYVGLVVILTAVIGILAGVHIRKMREWRVLETEYNNRITQIDKMLKETKLISDQRLKLADASNKAREELAKLLVKNEEELVKSRRLAADKVNPITVDQYKEYTVQLEGRIVLLQDSLKVAEDEIYTLRDVIKIKDDYIDGVEEKLLVQKDMNQVLRRLSKQDKRIKVWSNVLSGGAGLLVGFGLGKVGN